MSEHEKEKAGEVRVRKIYSPDDIENLVGEHLEKSIKSLEASQGDGEDDGFEVWVQVDGCPLLEICFHADDLEDLGKKLRGVGEEIRANWRPRKS